MFRWLNSVNSMKMKRSFSYKTPGSSINPDQKTLIKQELLSKIKKSLKDRSNSLTEQRSIKLSRPLKEKKSAKNYSSVTFSTASEKMQNMIQLSFTEQQRKIAFVKCKEEIFTKKLESYLLICIETGLIREGRSTLLHYRHSRTTERITYIGPYNVLIKGYALQNNFACMNEMLNHAIEDGFEPDVKTCSTFLSYLGGQITLNNEGEATLSKVFSYMDNLNITDSDIFEKILTTEDYHNVCNALQYFNRTYNPPKFENNKSVSYQYTIPILESLNNKIYNTKNNALLSQSTEELVSNAFRQLKFEVDRTISIPRIDQQQTTVDTNAYSGKIKAWEHQWRKQLLKKFIKKLRRKEYLFKKSKSFQINIYPFLVILPPEDYVDIMIKKAYECVDSYTSKSQICIALGQEVYNRYRISYMEKYKLLDKLKAIYLDYINEYNKDQDIGTPYLPRLKLNHICKDHSIKDIQELLGPSEWAAFIKQMVGGYLLDLMIENICITVDAKGVNQSFRAFYEVDLTNKVYALSSRIQSYPSLRETILKAKTHNFTMSPEECPMLSPPIPWISSTYGGNPLSQTVFIRLHEMAVVQLKRINEIGQEQIYPYLDGLNQVGSIPFKINKSLLKVAIELFNNNIYPEVDLPQHPNTLSFSNTLSRGTRKINFHDIYKSDKAKKEAYSKWITMLKRLSIANYFKNDTIWFPFTGDFRGRVYPHCGTFNHYDSDVIRSLFIYAEGKKLGPDGLNWLKVNVINLWGKHKSKNFNKKLKICEEIIEDIKDSAKNPISGRKWWMQCDDPWQSLAACIELTVALESDDPSEFISHLPVGQDGTCNGLQHYAALGRDTTGGIYVNLTPSERKQDIYQEVARTAEIYRQEDLNSDNESVRKIAEELEGYITRPAVKKNVMTSVYGVTYYGAANQVKDHLKDINFPDYNITTASSYVTRCIFKSMGDAFNSSRKIQDWLGRTAYIIAKVIGHPVEWISPIGLPIIQPYGSCKIVNDLILCIHSGTSFDYLMRLDPKKHKAGFPANFIHSLDATHMMLTSLHCQQAGIHFMSVHDSFSAHAADVGQMNKIIREQFISLHSIPILENLAQFCKSKLDDHEIGLGKNLGNEVSYNHLKSHFDQQFEKGGLDLENVINSEFFFS